VPKRAATSVWISIDMEGLGGVAAYSHVMMQRPSMSIEIHTLVAARFGTMAMVGGPRVRRAEVE